MILRYVSLFSSPFAIILDVTMLFVYINVGAGDGEIHVTDLERLNFVGLMMYLWRQEWT
jgi:hypothetical protein